MVYSADELLIIRSQLNSEPNIDSLFETTNIDTAIQTMIYDQCELPKLEIQKTLLDQNPDFNIIHLPSAYTFILN